MKKFDLKTAGQKAGLQIVERQPLAPLTNWRIGGPARWYTETKNAAEVRRALQLARKFEVPVFILGGGTNILVSDKGFPGLVIKITASAIEKRKDIVWADAGVAMGRLAAFTLQNGLLGMEWAIGLPGTVGGAVFGNSNCFGGSTANVLWRAETLDKSGKAHLRTKKHFRFGYDYSKLQAGGEVLLRAAFKLSPGSPKKLAALRVRIARNAEQRVALQPQGTGTAGSTFKAVKPTPKAIRKLSSACPDWRKGMRDGYISAGFIIDRCLGLKGYELDGMRISEKHANFFVNLGRARATGARKLIDFVKETCKNKLGIELEEEIKYVGEFPKIKKRK